jgi:hypothetical protein
LRRTARKNNAPPTVSPTNTPIDFADQACFVAGLSCASPVPCDVAALIAISIWGDDSLKFDLREYNIPPITKSKMAISQHQTLFLLTG